MLLRNSAPGRSHNIEKFGMSFRKYFLKTPDTLFVVFRNSHVELRNFLKNVILQSRTADTERMHRSKVTFTDNFCDIFRSVWRVAILSIALLLERCHPGVTRFGRSKVWM